MKTKTLFFSHLYPQDQHRHKMMNDKYLSKNGHVKWRVETIYVLIVFKTAIFRQLRFCKCIK